MGDLVLVRPTTVSTEASQTECFELPDLRVFTSIPEYHHGIVTLRGMVAVYETDAICREGVLDGAFYVVENQYPPARMTMDRWLRHEWEDSERRAQPLSPLMTSRRVVQLLRCRKNKDWWWHRLPSGFLDGPLEDWSIGFNLVGKMVGLYRPA